MDASFLTCESMDRSHGQFLRDTTRRTPCAKTFCEYPHIRDEPPREAVADSDLPPGGAPAEQKTEGEHYED